MVRTMHITGSVVAVLLFSGLAQAQPWGRLRGRWSGPHVALRPSADARANGYAQGPGWGSSRAQVQRIKAIRNDFFNQSAKLRKAMAQQRVELQALLRGDLPDEGQVLQRSRQLAGLRGQAA